jgi:hypothetical protein
MQSERKVISPLLYYIILSSVTSIVFILAGVIGFIFSSLRITDSFAIIIISALLIWKGAIVGVVTWFFHKNSHKKDFAVKFIGLYLGRFYGIFIGGFLGARIASLLKQAETIGFIVGALAFYFAGRWIGSKISVAIDDQLDKVFSILETQEPEKIGNKKSTNRFTFIAFILYSVVLPLLFVIIGLLINYFDIPIGYLTELLPISRIIVIVLSIFSICSPWLIKNRWLVIYQSMTTSPESIIYWLGLIFSIIPAVYGFILFIAMGASIIELCFYAVVSSIAAIFWSMNNNVVIKQKAG